MRLASRIPKDFYKLFNGKYRDYYIHFLMDIYREDTQAYSFLGLTEDECKNIIDDCLENLSFDWAGEQPDDEGVLLTRSNMASITLKRFEEWGWLFKEYDETYDTYVFSFPEYSQMFVELFCRLDSDSAGKERDSILAVYSLLYTYGAEPEKDNAILVNALDVSDSLLHMLANMQKGMGEYFDALSNSKDFKGVQKILMDEINNTDSKKYAILTTKDSFYRYKEEVKELIAKNKEDCERRKSNYAAMRDKEEADSPTYRRMDRGMALCDDAIDLLNCISRKIDAIEYRYNELIRRKTNFAIRASERMKYMDAEGAEDEDAVRKLVSILGRVDASEGGEILEKLASKVSLTQPYKVLTEQSFYHRRDLGREDFTPMAVSGDENAGEDMDDYILRPLYTDSEILGFRRKYESGGVFKLTDDSIRSVEDLEKLFLLWQSAVENQPSSDVIEIGPDERTAEGFSFSNIVISKSKEAEDV